MTTIGGATRLVALLGQPVAGSLSPRMQNAAFAARGLDWAYVALDVAPPDLGDVVRGIAAAGFAGANVTMPHKSAAAVLCDELDELSRTSEPVNTLVFADGRVSGFNTDGPAVVSAIDDAAGKRALVLGRGGAARVVAAALERAGAQTTLASRSDPDWPPDGAEADIVVNATPVRDELIVEPRPGQQVVDLAYSAGAGPTALVRAARAAGCATVDGAEILVRQGAASFELWTGLLGPVEVMRAAVSP
jgi:shikimate dehydrogenase